MEGKHRRGPARLRHQVARRVYGQRILAKPQAAQRRADPILSAAADPDSEHHHLSVQPGIDEPLLHAVGSAGQRRSRQGRSENRSQPRAALRSARDFQPHPGAGRGGRAGGAGQPSHCGGRGRGRPDRSHGNASLPAGRQHAGKSAERSFGTRRKLAHGCGGGT